MFIYIVILNNFENIYLYVDDSGVFMWMLIECNMNVFFEGLIFKDGYYYLSLYF